MKLIQSISSLISCLAISLLLSSCKPTLTQELIIKMSPSEKQIAEVNLKENIDQTLSIISSRLNKYGLNHHIQLIDSISYIYSVQLPEIENIELLQKLITNTGDVGFWEVYKNKELSVLHQQIFESKYLRQKFIASPINNDSPLMGFAQVKDTSFVMNFIDSISRNTFLADQIKFAWEFKPEDSKKNLFALYALKRTNSKKGAAMNGESIVKANAQPSEYGPSVWFVHLDMNTYGAQQWEQLTQSNIGKALAITIDDKVYSAPNVHTKIEGGKTSITGNFDEAEAKEMALILSSGHLPLKLKIIEILSNQETKK